MLIVLGETSDEAGFVSGPIYLFGRLRWQDRNVITHEVSPRFLSSFLRSATVSLSQLLERRTVETNDRLLEFATLNKGPVTGRSVGSILSTR
jgi:hypothetical protein